MLQAIHWECVSYSSRSYNGRLSRLPGLSDSVFINYCMLVFAWISCTLSVKSVHLLVILELCVVSAIMLVPSRVWAYPTRLVSPSVCVCVTLILSIVLLQEFHNPCLLCCRLTLNKRGSTKLGQNSWIRMSQNGLDATLIGWSLFDFRSM